MPGVESVPSCFYSDEFHRGIVNKSRENPGSVRSTPDARHHRLRQLAGALHRHDGVVEGWCGRVVGDRGDLCQLLLHAGGGCGVGGVIAVLGVVQLWSSPPEQSATLIWGGTALRCPFYIVALAAPVLRHRLLLSFTAEAEGRSADDVVAALLRGVPFPGA